MLWGGIYFDIYYFQYWYKILLFGGEGEGYERKGGKNKLVSACKNTGNGIAQKRSEDPKTYI